ncbi:hypothetical protein HPP92_008558 [Vanilla planifolia]|uniref:Lunapark zinc ribbon domain-containing protein n=1 Tax=Vanilla planifolia TaxID=51239 RepID=A0A835V230_VANPL|nr:hypothetical protein HPP92_008558 [Vanilla planifolia]
MGMSEGIETPKECVAADEEPAPRKWYQRSGILSRMWRGIFRLRSEDYEKKLQHLSKEEAAVQSRMKMRALSARKRARNLILFSATFEVVAVAFAVIAIRSLDFTGPMKFVRTLPAILLPCLSYVVHLAHQSLTRMLDHMDQKTLEKLRAERKAKIDELKERTNYYTTQQLIQRYDLDPAAKLAAATVLASRLGTESGLKVHMTDNPTTIVEETKSEAIKQANSTAQNRHQKLPMAQLPEISGDVGANQLLNTDVSPTPLVVEHYCGFGTSDQGWITRIAALLVGDNPSHCSALICGNCHRHNGLVRKEEFPYISYYCPHCGALNTSKQKVEQESQKLCSSEGVFTRNGSNGKLETSTGEENFAPSIKELPESD